MKKGTWKNIVNAIEEMENIFIFHHIRPDGDCLGSQFGLGKLIQKNFPKKNVFFIGDSKNILNFLNFNHDDEKTIDSKFFKNSLGIVVDASSADRLEKVELIHSKKITKMARIDHHPNLADINYDINWVDSSYVAAAEMIGYLAMKAKWKITPEAAEYIYLGINTDSGRFLFANTSARTFSVVSHLLKNNLNLDRIHLNLAQKSLNLAKFNGEVLLNFKTKGKVNYYYVTREIQEKYNLKYEEASQVNILSNVGDSRIWIFFIDQADSFIRVRLRSNGPKVNIIGRQYNGGGHDQASGAMIKDPEIIDEIVEKAAKLAEEYINEKR
ncbi:DHH family phosphoesterase [Mesomycoplasma neurolyticum]|uniref:Bifunctional oligoribonuclease and PAP phosphatase nrnA n=1 Tax=Mesomycoplasma neurolyticum TaxID=2120 RepID=A0A449A5X3_9BACT|nr:bifunctional oligoribonuclease/PAP phosphatase NrnA [Mesomycoplasma neurolyticum]VEU59629.1 Bifunctional oligoribonuclease and PAP phosphatase nrnA [Mesomycoplasma neurolyticum]